jgi:Fe-S-cluster-containing dehydrogenase component
MSCNDNEHATAGTELVTIRTERQEAHSRKFWKNVEALAETEPYKRFLNSAFRREGEKPRGGISRRDLFKLLGASAGLAGLTACTKMPIEKIFPYVNSPEEFKPGNPLFFATSMPWGGAAQGVLAWSFMGRPTKIEGNDEHPGSMGRANVFMQGSVLDLYDPDRSQVVVHEGMVAAWGDFLDLVAQLRATYLRNQGAGLRFLTGTVTSPSLGDQMNDLLKQFPQAQWHQYEAISRDNVREGARMTFGEYVETIYRFDQADVVVSLDSDFLFAVPGGVRYACDFANKRRVNGPESPMNRLYAVEAVPTITGSQADHRLRLRASEVETFARALASALGVDVAGLGNQSAEGVPANWIPALAKDLKQHQGSSVIVAGDSQPPVVHVLAHAMNAALGNVGKTLAYTAPIEVNPVNQAESLRQLVFDMEAGRVQTLVILGGNPAYSAPADIPFAQHLTNVQERIYWGLFEDETAVLCNWHVPATHYLESWGDLRAYDGTVSTVQPLIAPLYDGKSDQEVLTLFQGQAGRSAHTIVHDYWRSQLPKLSDQDFEVQWETWLEKGIIGGTSLPAKKVAIKKGLSLPASGGSPQSAGLELVFMPDPTIWDGSFCNNGWLQELPKPFSKLTWDNVVTVSPATAERLHQTMESVQAPYPQTAGVESGLGELVPGPEMRPHNVPWWNLGPYEKLENELVEINYRGRKVLGALFVVPGQADDCIAVTLGYGRSRAGRFGSNAGFNAYTVRTADAPWFGTGVKLSKTGKTYPLAVTQYHYAIEKHGAEVSEEGVAAFRRDLVRVANLDEFRQNPNFAKDPPEMTTEAQTLYPVLPSPYDFKKSPQWGMAIDLTACIGCNACVVACQAENNVPVVGKDQTGRGRYMHWIRVDTYYRGGLHEPEIYNEVLPCMQCENAPCEYVCPVGATVTGPEGINQQIYNRCVGTRYCSNNCPWKVRRFNFYRYADWTTPSFYAVENPTVTVRSRGVMEKCTYCIQRIRYHEIKAEEAGRNLRDGEVLTACQQTCPTNAIVFGDILDPNSQVSKLKAQSRNYGLLEDLNTRPRTTYLAKVWNPNPEIKES